MFNILIINFKWMTFNAFLAIIPVFLGVFMNKTKVDLFKILLVFFWILFLPNTIYLLSDPINIIGDFHKLFGIYLIIDLIFYVLLIPVGIFSYVISIDLFLKAFFHMRDRIHDIIIIAVNILLGFGIILGRIERINSWEAISNIPKVTTASIKVLTSAQQVFFVLIWAAVAEVVYLLLRKPVWKMVSSGRS